MPILKTEQRIQTENEAHMVLENKKKCYPLQKKQIKTTKYLSSPTK